MVGYMKPRPRGVALLSLLVLLGCRCLSLAQQDNHGRIFAAYFEEWGVHQAGYNIADIEKSGIGGELDYLIYAFGNVTPGSTQGPTPACAIADPVLAYRDASLPGVSGKGVSGKPYVAPVYGNFGAILQLKQLHPKLKVLISLGGQLGDPSGWIAAAQTPSGRAALASSCIDLFIKGKIAPGIEAPGIFDGFNIDWEFPGPADRENFTALLREFRTQLNALSMATGKKYVLSFDSPAFPTHYVNIDLRAAAEQVDFLTIDGYDYAGQSDKQTNELSPLYNAQDNPMRARSLSIDETVRAYLDAGVAPAKYLMGFPLYAVGWTGVPNVNHGLYQTSTGASPVLLADGSGVCPHADKADPSPGCDRLLTPGNLTYSTIRNLINKNGYAAWFDAERKEATLYNPATETFYTYDDPASVAEKTAYIRKYKLGGAYVWALGQDDADGSLTKALATGLK